MSKYHKIKWRDQDHEELARAVRNFNAKIDRLAKRKKNPLNKSVLPERVSLRELKKLINTRQDLKREINALKRFSKKGSETIVTIPGTDYNIQVTRWQKTEMNRRIAKINQRREKRLDKLKELEMTSRGESLGYTKSQIGMGKMELLSLEPKVAFTRRMLQGDLKWKWKSIMFESQSDYFDQKDFRARDSFIKGLKENFNYNDIKDVIESIEKMDIGDFINRLMREGDFEWIYPPDEELYQGYVDTVKRIYLNKGE